MQRALFQESDQFEKIITGAGRVDMARSSFVPPICAESGPKARNAFLKALLRSGAAAKAMLTAREESDDGLSFVLMSILAAAEP